MSLLRLRAEEGVRRVALGFLDEARDAAPRVRTDDDTEALHDLRVALRRLRSTLRAYPDAVEGAIPKKRRAALRALVQSTSAGRDAEVQIAWLEEASLTLDAAAQRGAEVWKLRLTDTRDRVYRALREEKLEALETLIARLSDDLGRYVLEHVVGDDDDAARFGAVVVSAARTELTELVTRLERVRSVEDEALAHEARIAGKRLRYVLEPVRDAVPQGARAISTLKGLQERLGELQDLAVRTAALSHAIEDTALERARSEVDLAVSSAEHEPSSGDEHVIEPGLLALLRVAQSRKRALLAELVSHYVEGEGLRTLEAEIAALLGALEAETRGGPPREIERKYLLRAVPPFVKGKPYARLAQGYVPGEAIVERVRRKSDASGTKYVRTVKLGRGIERIEIEETISRGLFTKLWPLTEGKRVEKRRYAIADAGLTWELDVFTDRELVLCEVELAHAEEAPALPDWLEPYVEREVTDEDTYVNANLAR